jgi:hypothetical protein
MTVIGTMMLTILVSATTTSGNGWKGIVLLRSSRTEVERKLGPPVEPCGEMCRYKTRNEDVDVRYSTQPCGETDNNRWRVPTGTVVSITVQPHVWPRLKDLKLNLRKLEKTKDPELSGYTHYTNEREGISYSVTETGRVYSIYWYPVSEDPSVMCK